MTLSDSWRARAQKKSVRKQPLPPKIPKWKISHTINSGPHLARRVYAALKYNQCRATCEFFVAWCSHVECKRSSAIKRFWVRVCQKLRFRVLKSANFEESAFLIDFFNKIVDYDERRWVFMFSEVLDRKNDFWSFWAKSILSRGRPVGRPYTENRLFRLCVLTINRFEKREFWGKCIFERLFEQNFRLWWKAVSFYVFWSFGSKESFFGHFGQNHFFRAAGRTAGRLAG